MLVKGPNPAEALRTNAEPALSAFLQAMHLKRLYRQGWLKRGVGEAACESVADHSYGVALLALLAPEPEGGPPLDRARAVLLAVVHELGEVHAGDITPVDGVSPEEKARRERDSLERVLDGLDGGTASFLRALWEEFETGASAEARFVRRLDRLEMGIQAAVYKAEGRPRMDEFLLSAERAVGDGGLGRILRTAADSATIDR